MPRADLHAHSCFSFDVPDLSSLTPRALFEATLDNADPVRRMDFFCLTDHDTLGGYENLVGQLPEADRRLVIPAVEHTLFDPEIGFTIHVNLYFMDPDRYAELQARVRTLDELLDFCDEHGVIYQYNHPTWWEKHELKAGMVDFEKVPLIARRFPVLELNASRTAAANLVTVGIAGELGKALTANGDSHSGHLGFAWTSAAGATAQDFMANVWTGRGDTHAAFLTRESLRTIVNSLIDGILDQEGNLTVDGNTMRTGHRGLEQVLNRMVRSRFLRTRSAPRAALRLALKQLARPIIHRWLMFERSLEHRLAESGLGVYLASGRSAH